MDLQRREMLFATLTSAAAASLAADAATPRGAKDAAVNPLAGSASQLRKPAGVRLGIGLTCPSPELAQICAHSGFDVVLIDMEHGPISIESASRMVTATLGTSAEAWIRVAANDATLIKLALDTGARNIVVPMVTTKAEAEQAVAAAKYPPRGVRGWGPFRAQYQWQTNMIDYAQRADRETQVTALIEHPRAIENLDEILARRRTRRRDRGSARSRGQHGLQRRAGPSGSSASARVGLETRSRRRDLPPSRSPSRRNKDAARWPVARPCCSWVSTRCSCR